MTLGGLYRAIIRRAKLFVQRLKHAGKKRVLVLGDSHIEVFDYINKNYSIPYFFEVGYVSGATALGVSNPNSKTNALSIFRKKLQRTNPSTPVILQLGEVDCGFVIWFLAEKKNSSVEVEFNRSINNYKKFVEEEIFPKNFEHVTLMSATLPTLKENTPGLGEVANLRKEVTTSQEDRTQLTLKYNQALNEFCSAHSSLNFFSTDADMLGDNGLIKEAFLNTDPLDHHNDMKAYSELIVRKLSEIDYNIFK